jgi:glycosyltransferase involved in cell wall biosynthesis
MTDSAPLPLVTIAIPNYNHGRYLKQCIQSALDQTYANLEVLVSDNASTDDSISVIESFHDPRLRWWRNATNLGVFPNWDRLVGEGRGEYFKLLQSDDWLEKDFVKECVEAMGHTQADAAFTGFRAVGDQEWEVLPSRFGHRGKYVAVSKETIARQIASINVFVHPTVGIYRAGLVPEGYGGDRNSLTKDTVYWAKAVSRGSIVFVNRVLAAQRFHPAQDRRRKDTSRGAGDLLDALDLLRGLESEGAVEAHARDVACTYGRSVLANLLRGEWGISARAAMELHRHSRLLRALTDAVVRAGR